MQMQKKRRNGRASTKTPIEDEIAHLRDLDLGGLRARWQGVFRRPAPAHLTRHLLFSVIAYRNPVGDLDHATLQVRHGALNQCQPLVTVPVNKFLLWSPGKRRSSALSVDVF